MVRMDRRGGIGIGLVLAGICSVQSGAAVAKLLFDYLDPAAVTWLRLGFASLILLAISRPRMRSWDRRTWRAVVLLGVALAGMNLLFYLAADRIPLALAVTCELVGPLVLALALSRRWVDALWVLLAGAGVAIIGAQSLTGALDAIGVLLAIAAGACWAGYIMSSHAVGELVPGVGGLTAAMCIAAIVTTPFGAVQAVEGVVAQPWLLLPALGVAILSSAIAYAFELAALRRIPPRVFGVLMSLEPVAAGVFALLIVGELIGGIEVVALGIVVAASIGVALTASRTPPVTPDTAPIVQQ
ncbi:DMT family transporter [Agrococcus versicolor]|uniref:DMT family transporter n=2 Tax=Agrococcus versicolor TaxID=501482 RepID=A0ABN3AVK5_9MICO